jgi:hypothetical protein
MTDTFSIDPKSAVLHFIINKGVDYYTSNVTFDKQKEFKERADELLENLLNYLEEKL